MAGEEKSLVFGLRRVKNFVKDINKSYAFSWDDMNGTSENFRIVFSDNCSDNIEACIDSNGKLKNTVNLLDIGNDGKFPLLFNNDNYNRNIIKSTVPEIIIDVGNGDVLLKGIFLICIKNNNNYVMAYDIWNKQVPINNEVTIPFSLQDDVLWEILSE